MKALTRRQLLIGSLLAWLPAKPILAVSLQVSSAASLEGTLAAFVDTLLPEDQYGPSASTIGVPLALLTEAKTAPQLRQLIEKGCLWLDQQSAGNFARLPPPYKAQLISWMATQASPHKIPGLFYRHLRHLAVSHYYANPSVQTTLGLTHPPQPLGYSLAGKYDP